MEPIRMQLNIELPLDLITLSSVFANNGHRLYLVGGAVRDAILGRDPKDLDVATDASPDRIEEILRNSIDAFSAQPTVLPIGKSFGVIRVIFSSGLDIEIATFRNDVGSGRRPDAVVFSTIEEDVLRRDLTINALFFDIDASEVVDFVGGIADIRNGVVRSVGSPRERFDEDRLRILRAVRFAAQMGCDLDIETERAIIDDNRLHQVSPERVREELLKSISKAHSIVHLVSMVTRLDLWSEVLPGLCVNAATVHEIRHPAVLLAFLLRDNDVHVLSRRLNELKFNNDEVRQITFLVSFMNLSIENVLRLRRQFDNSCLERADVELFSNVVGSPDQRMLNAFMMFNFSVGGQLLLDEGFSGRELGRELERREIVLFSQILNDN